MNNHRIVIGIDKGTTKTVVAFALPDNLPQLWVPPDGPGWIIPTAIDYDGNGQTFWGNAAAERPNPRIWFKLFIKGSPAVDLQGHNLVGATGGTVGHDNADRLIGDFLSVLQQQLRVHLQGYGPARIEWCFTEPGCWSDEGRLDFRNIVQDRVFNGHARDVSYVSEAEAAAEYTTAEGVYRGLIQQGDVVMVGDCGGATTDLAILQVTGTNPFASQPIGKPDSFRLGAVDIDAALMEQVRRRYWPNDRGLRRGAPAARVRREVSRIKEDFTGLPEDDVPQFELQTPNGEVVEHQFTDADLRRAFNPTVTQIVEAIIQKILLAEARVTKVVLVGGLGSSEYLRSRVRLALDGLDRAFQLVDVLPDTITSAVARGAVLRAQRSPHVQLFESRSDFQLSFPFVNVYRPNFPSQVLSATIIPRGRRNVPVSGFCRVADKMRVVPDRMDGRVLGIYIVRPAEIQASAIEQFDIPANAPVYGVILGRVHEYSLKVFWSIHLGSPLFIHWKICVVDPQDQIRAELAQFFRKLSPADMVPVVN